MGFKDNVLCITIFFNSAFIFHAQELWELNVFSLGIETTGGLMNNIIPSGTLAGPIKTSQLFRTNMDNQTSVLIKVYEGECVYTKDCWQRLGRFELSGITPAPRRASRIEVTFHIDGYGGVHVTAEDKLSKKSITVTMPSNPTKMEEYKNRAVDNQEDFWKMLRPASGRPEIFY